METNNNEVNESDEISGKKIGTLEIAEEANAYDIELMINGIEKPIAIEAVSNEDGTYDIVDTKADQT